MRSSTPSKFGPEVLLVFIGHSRDASDEAQAIRDLEREFARQLDLHQEVTNGALPFKSVRCWEWTYDAPPEVGGQEVTITPELDRANIALFVFKERIGAVTWSELERVRTRPAPIPVVAFFPANHPSNQMSDIPAAEAWVDLLRRKQSLTADWAWPDSKSLKPTTDYLDIQHLRQIVLEQMKGVLGAILRLPPPVVEFSHSKMESGFLSQHPHLEFDQQTVLRHTVEELEQENLQQFLRQPLSQEALQKHKKGDSNLTLAQSLHLLDCANETHPTLGAFLCFAPWSLLAGQFSGCRLQMSVHSSTKPGSSKISISKAKGNLLQLYYEGIEWLTKGAGLRRRGRIGSADRDELEIPEIVLREALANALVHRDYEERSLRSQPTRLSVFPDRVEITSFGKLLPVVSVESLNKGINVVSIPRNPVTAEVFQAMTLVELEATGVARMRLEMEKASLAFPRFIADLHESVVRVILSRPSDWDDEFVPQPPQPRRGQMMAYLSSTSMDLPEHRREVEKACLREGIFPIGMESLPARDADAIRVSIEMVNKADIYIGVLAWRYGHKPEGHDISLTEMEFNRAVERGIPILVFFIHKEHPLTIEMVETDKDAQQRLTELKERASKDRGRREFKSPQDLRGEVIQALSNLQQREQESSGETAAPSFHPPNNIPAPPEPYIAHPYSLLQTKDVVGRQIELNLLTDWVTTNKQVPADTRIFNLVAIGGMGKSALTWKWFNDIAPSELPKLAGRMWWSFYESDAHWDNFIIRALAYVSGLSEKEVREMKSPDREDHLWQILDQQPFLLVLDGLERILLAYARMDAAQMLDDDLDQETAHEERMFTGIPENIRETYLQKHRLRQCVDANAGRFLRRLTTVRASRILVSTRLYPAELQTNTAQPWPACFVAFLKGLSDDDAINLWREFGVTGARDQLLKLFNAFGNYPLLIRALAGEIANYRSDPGNFDQWMAQNPEFSPGDLDLKNAKTHVLEYSLRGLNDAHRRVLDTIAAFRMPATWDTLRALLVEQEHNLPSTEMPISKSKVKRSSKPCPTDQALDLILAELEDRGLVGWDKQSNRYDIHPIVRGVVWQTLDGQSRKGIYTDLRAYFEAVPRPPDYLEVESLEDLTPAIELYQSLIGLARYQDAFELFRDYLDDATLYRLSASRQRVELLERLFPDGIEGSPRLETARDQRYALNTLALAYQFRGEPSLAIPFFRRAAQIDDREKTLRNYAVDFYNLSGALRVSAASREAQSAARKALQLSRQEKDEFLEAVSLYLFGLSSATCGAGLESEIALKRSLIVFLAQKKQQEEGVVNSYLAERLLWFGNPKRALHLAQRAWELAKVNRFEADFIRAARLHGAAALGLNDLDTAAERLQHALTRARAVSRVDEELPTLVALAELHRCKKEFSTGRELLDQIWDFAEHGSYPLFHADALNVLAQIERDEGNREAAIAAATKAYTLSWCDGPPYAYHYGLTNARKHLKELGAPEPKLPPFDESKFEPMPEVELNPKDKFWVDPDKLDSL